MQLKARKILFLLEFVAITALMTGLQACADFNPIAQAKTTEQKALAVYGSYTIIKEQAAALYVDSATPQAVKDALKTSNDATAPTMENLYKAYLASQTIREELEAGVGTPERLAIATAHLGEWYVTAVPIFNDFKSSFDKVKK